MRHLFRRNVVLIETEISCLEVRERLTIHFDSLSSRIEINQDNDELSNQCKCRENTDEDISTESFNFLCLKFTGFLFGNGDILAFSKISNRVLVYNTVLVLAVSNVLTALIFSNSRSFETEGDTLKKHGIKSLDP